MKKILYSVEKFIVNHPFIMILLGFLFFQEELSSGDIYILLSICFLAATYSYRIQNVYNDATSALSFNQWGIYNYYVQTMTELGVKYQETSEKEEVLRYKEVANHIKNGGKAENFVPSKELVDLKKRVLNLSKSYEASEKRRNNIIGAHIKTLMKLSENKGEYFDFLTEKEEEPDYSNWKVYSVTFDELAGSLSDLK